VISLVACGWQAEDANTYTEGTDESAGWFLAVSVGLYTCSIWLLKRDPSEDNRMGDGGVLLSTYAIVVGVLELASGLWVVFLVEVVNRNMYFLNNCGRAGVIMYVNTFITAQHVKKKKKKKKTGALLHKTV
jgi:hypothetical protein